MRLKILYVLEIIMLAVFLVGCSDKNKDENAPAIEASEVSDSSTENNGDTDDEEAKEDNTVETTTEHTTEILTTEEALVVIPELSGTDETVAQTVLLNNGLIPVVDYTYSDYVDIGKVVSLSYETGEEVPKNTNVTIYISKGKENYYCESYSVSWSNSNPNWSDSWSVTNAYIEEGVLNIWMSGNMIMDCMWTSGGQATVDGYTYTTVSNDLEYVAHDMDVTQYPTFTIDLNQLGLYSPNISNITLSLPYECMNGLKTYTFTFNFVWQ